MDADSRRCSNRRCNVTYELFDGWNVVLVCHHVTPYRDFGVVCDFTTWYFQFPIENRFQGL